MTINQNAAMVEDHGLPTRETGDGVNHQEVQCPVCHTWRPAFCVTKLDAGGAMFFGTEWACDAEISKWLRIAAAT